MDERLEQMANGLAGSADAGSGDGPHLSPADIGGIFGDAVTDDTVTDDSILFAKVVCHDQKKRGGSLKDAMALVDMWHERFGRDNFYGASLKTIKSLVARYWDGAIYPDPDLESQYYDMVTRLYF